MTKRQLIDQLRGLDDDAEVRVGDECSIEDYEVINVIVEDGKAVIEFRDEEE